MNDTGFPVPDNKFVITFATAHEQYSEIVGTYLHDERHSSRIDIQGVRELSRFLR